ncbi:hypothetical protein EON65_14795 [archaeon]|nr:MAG: hypothetical protein EON65_14795 [archaeon]
MTFLFLKRRNFNRVVIDSHPDDLNEEQKKQRYKIFDDVRYYFKVLCSYLYCCDENGKKTAELYLNYREGKAAAIPITPAVVTTPLSPAVVTTPLSPAVSDTPVTPSVITDHVPVVTPLTTAVVTTDESQDSNVIHEPDEESQEGAPVRRSPRIPTRRTDLPVESTVGKRSRSVVARCSQKKRRLVTDTTASRDEEFLSKLCEVTEEYASSCDASLIARVRKFLSELTGKPSHEEEEEDEEEEEEEEDSSSDSTSSSDPLAHLPYWNDNM